MFAEMLVQARGYGDVDDIAKKMSLVDIIYEMKKAEEPKKVDPLPVSGPVEVKITDPEPEPEPEPEVITKIKDFWSRLTHDSDSD